MNHKFALLLAGALATTSPLAYADDFVVNDAQTTTNGGNVMDGDDTLTITDTGSIDTSGSINDAVETTGANNAVANAGTLKADQSGIITGAGATITNEGVIEGNGGYGALAGDDATIDNQAGGSITGFFYGLGLGNAANVTNEGSIEGLVAAGVDAGDDATIDNQAGGSIMGGDTGLKLGSTANVTNAGSIEGTNDFGVLALDEATIDNKAGGSIKGGSDGLILTNKASVTNAGSIEGGDYHGVFAGDEATIDNKTGGSIKGGDTGLFLDDKANVTNAGSIEGTSGAGVDAGSDTMINNMAGGMIISNTNAITVGDNSDITNAGMIVAPLANDAIVFDGAGNTLTLMGASTVVGGIDLGGGTEVAAITGNGHNGSYYFTAGTLTDGTPVITGDGIGVYDPLTGILTVMDTDGVTQGLQNTHMVSINAADAVSGMMSNWVNNLGGTPAGSLALNGEGERISGVNAGNAYAGFNSLWVTGFLGDEEESGTANAVEYSANNFGTVTGADWRLGGGTLLGAFAGYVSAELEGASVNGKIVQNDQTGWLLGSYFQLETSGIRLDVMGMGGMLSHDNQRLVGNAVASGDADSMWLSAETALTTALARFGRNRFTIEPSLRLRYTYQSVDGYTESGVPAPTAATFGEYSPQFGEAMVEMRTIFQPNKRTAVALFGGVGVVQTLSGENVDITINGVKNSVQVADDTQARGNAGVDWQVPLGNIFDVSVRAQANFREGKQVQPAGALTLRSKF